MRCTSIARNAAGALTDFDFSRLCALLTRCGISDKNFPAKGQTYSFQPLFTNEFHFENHHYTTLGDCVIQRYVGDAVEEYFARGKLNASMHCATELAACLHNHFSLRLCAEQLQFQELCSPISSSGGGLPRLEPRRKTLSPSELAGTSFAYRPLACAQDTLGWKFSHFIGTVHRILGPEIALDIVHRQLQLRDVPNFPLVVATRVRDVVEHYPTTSVAEAILGAQGLTASYSAKSIIIGDRVDEESPIGSEQTASAGQQGATESLSKAASDVGSVSPQNSESRGLRSALSSLAAGPPYVNAVSLWQKKNHQLQENMGGDNQDKIVTGWLNEEQRAQAKGRAYANQVAFKTYFADHYHTPQPVEGRWVYRFSRPPVRDAQYYDKTSDMRHGIPFDTKGLSVEDYAMKISARCERRFEVSMNVGLPARPVAKVISRTYTEGRVALSRIFLHRLVKDIESIAANAAVS